MQDVRFSDYGKLAPKKYADLAFVQHMIHQLSDDGTMAVVLPHGVLFRPSAESHIREVLIKDKNFLDAVIGLPENLFYGTDIPTCILLFKKNRVHEDGILFVDASECFERGTQNQLRECDIEKILEVVKERKSVDKFSNLVSLEEVINRNESVIYIPRYVDTFVPGANIDLTAVSREIIELEKSEKELDESVRSLFEALNVEEPMGKRK